VSGYSCEDHFHEIDTFIHCDQSLAVILESDLTVNMLCDIGCPILHNNVRYNCRVFCLDRKIVLIRPKISLADDGNYREKRFFTPWNYRDRTLHDHTLSDVLRKITKQTTVPIGLAVLTTEETTIASEMCEELWTADSPHINLYLSGVEIVSNGSGSHHELRKLDSRIALMTNSTQKCGGAYMYSNLRGCDGNRLYFDGSSLICMNGQILTQASQFSLNDVEVITAAIDLESIRSHRGGINSLQEQSSHVVQLPTIDIRHFSLRPDRIKSAYDVEQSSLTSLVIDGASVDALSNHTVRRSTPEEECCLGPACWLWDYLRRSGAAGFLLPLSGGADSASVASIVHVSSLTTVLHVILIVIGCIISNIAILNTYHPFIYVIIPSSPSILDAYTG
jgi:NAD+ synthase (glutamine-hydrolysing)